MKHGRGRILILVLGVLLVVVGASIAVPQLWENRPGPARPLGTWGSYLRLELPSGWSVSTRRLTPESETVELESAAAARAGWGCRVTVWSLGVTPPKPAPAGDARVVAVRVDGRSGRLVTSDQTATLRWTYARDAEAEASCDTAANPEPDLLREIAGRWLTIAPAVRRLPFTLDGRAPRAPVVEVELDEWVPDGQPILASLRMEAVSPPGGWSLSLGLVADDVAGAASPGTRTGANGLVVQLAADGSQGCLERAPAVCAQAYWNGDALPPRGAAISTALVVGLLGSVRLADPLDDPAAWFELDTALA